MFEITLVQESMTIGKDYIKFKAIVSRDSSDKNIEVIFKDRALRNICEKSGSQELNWKKIFDNHQFEIKQVAEEQLNASHYQNLGEVPFEITITM